jgi:DNA-binding MarR family transcriptional regulator
VTGSIDTLAPSSASVEDDHYFHLLHLLHRAGQRADDLFSSGVHSHSLTPRQYTVLKAASELDDPSQAGLVAATGIDRSTLADIVRRLVDKELIHRQRTVQDARAYAIRVTEKGAETLRDLEPKIAEIENQLLQAVPASLRPTFLQCLQALVTHLDDDSSSSSNKSGHRHPEQIAG